jgi:hypothetical protein
LGLCYLIVVFVMAVIWFSLASEVVEDFLELAALLLELGLYIVDEGIETSLVGVQALLNLDGGQGRWRYPWGVASMTTSSSWIITNRDP